MRLTWLLTGRSQEMRIVQDALLVPDTTGIVICGAARVGKSRTAREALEPAASAGWEIRRALAASSARQLPLCAFASRAGSDTAEHPKLVRGVIDALTSARDGAKVREVSFPVATFVKDFEYRCTRSALPLRVHVRRVADELNSREQALRELPLPYSLALRLRDAGVAREVICEYVDIEEASLDAFYRIAEAKLVAVQQQSSNAYHRGRHATSSRAPKCVYSDARAFHPRVSDAPTVVSNVGTTRAAGCNSECDYDGD